MDANSRAILDRGLELPKVPPTGSASVSTPASGGVAFPMPESKGIAASTIDHTIAPLDPDEILSRVILEGVTGVIYELSEWYTQIDTGSSEASVHPMSLVLTSRARDEATSLPESKQVLSRSVIDALEALIRQIAALRLITDWSGVGGGGSGSTTLDDLTDTEPDPLTYGTGKVLIGDGVNSFDENFLDAQYVTFSPGDATDWNAGDPGNVDDALDQLADNLAYLLPPLPSILDDIGWTTANGPTGKITWDATHTIANYNNWTGHNIDETFPASGNDHGIYSSSYTVTGTLNDDVSAHAYSYVADAFSPGNQGTLELYIDGVRLASVDCDLTSTSSAIDTRNGNGTGFQVSALQYCKFATGDPFTPRTYRTGTWHLNSADVSDAGYHTVQVKHKIGVSYTPTDIHDWIEDASVTATSFSGLTFSNVSLTTGSKYLSGVQYYVGGSLRLDVDVDNAYRNTYSASASAVNHIVDMANLQDPTDASLGASGGDEALQVQVRKTLNFITSGIRLFDSWVYASVSIDRTVQSDLNSGNTALYNILMDNVSASSTDSQENFDDENYRIQGSGTDFNTNLSSNWDETQSLVGASAGHNEGAQVIMSLLDYPNYNFGGIANGPPGNPNYSSASGVRYFFRYFYNASGYSNFSLNIQGSATLVQEGTLSTGTDEVAISIRLPTQTGWMDISQNYVPGAWGSTGDSYNTVPSVGCYSSSLGSDNTIPTSDLGITVGTKTTTDSYGKVYLRISVPQGWTGYLTSIGITWGA